MLRSLTFFLLAMLGAAAASAQTPNAATPTTPPTAARTHDISLFSQYGGGFANEGTFDVYGGIYRWAKPRTTQTFWKAGLGVGSSFEVTGRRTLPISADSVVAVELWRNERVYMMLGGVETERHLWRGLYLTAGLEAQAGGSGGRLDSVVRRVATETGAPYNGDLIGSPARLAGTRRFFGTGLALLGIRAYAGRFTTALELFTGFQIAAQQELRPNSDLTIFDLSLGGSGGRFSVGYRF